MDCGNTGTVCGPGIDEVSAVEYAQALDEKFRLNRSFRNASFEDKQDHHDPSCQLCGGHSHANGFASHFRSSLTRVDRMRLMECLEQGIVDPTLLQLIGRIIKSGIICLHYFFLPGSTGSQSGG